MAYKYKAYTSDKKIVEGTIDVSSESVAEGTLYRAGYERVLSLAKVDPGISVEKWLPTIFGVKSQDVIEFAGQLATLLESGISIITALRLLDGQTSRRPFKKVIDGLIEAVQGGSSFSQALTRFPHAFPDSFYQVIRASEQTGRLDAGLKQAAAYLEKQATTNQKMKRAMVYPAFVLTTALGVCILLITVAMPPLISLFDSLGAKLPWTTELLISVTDFLLKYAFQILISIFILILLAMLALRFPSVKMARDRFLLTMPILGVINVESAMQRFCQTASMLLAAGLRLPQIMEIAISSHHNLVVRQALGQVRERLLQGEGLSQPMSENPVFPSLLVEMVVIGEKTGSIDSSLETLADYYSKKVARRIDMLISMIEPVLTLLIGAAVMFIALSLITPLYSILRSMS
jgi:type IV pilus assembly protein PilC